MARCPFATWKPISGSSGPHTGGPFKIVHHTTEGSTAQGAMQAFATKRSDPHFTVDATRIYQHIDTAEGARALRNAPGGVQTNRDSAVQIELVGFAHLPKNPDALARLARLCRWIEATHGVPRVWPAGPPKPARQGKDPGGHVRDPAIWDTRAGHYGHSQVPENTHWDPGYTAQESAFVLNAEFDAAGRLRGPRLEAGRSAAARRSPAKAPRSTMPDHAEVGAVGEGEAEAAGRPLQQALARPRICFERILPDALDAEQHARRELRKPLLAAMGRKPGAGEVENVARMAVRLTKRWPSGTTLRCRFLDGSPKMRAKVKKHAKLWEAHAHVRLRFVEAEPAELRISFYADDGSWSAVGRDALNRAYFPLHQPTMNFGWVRDDSDETEDRAVVLHEFGHALGCIHEHQSPRFNRRWNRAAVLKSFQGPPNYWSEAEIVSNVLDKYSAKGTAATVFDPASIMLYHFAAELFDDEGGATNENSSLSLADQAMIAKMYPPR